MKELITALAAIIGAIGMVTLVVGHLKDFDHFTRAFMTIIAAGYGYLAFEMVGGSPSSPFFATFVVAMAALTARFAFIGWRRG